MIPYPQYDPMPTQEIYQFKPTSFNMDESGTFGIWFPVQEGRLGMQWTFHGHLLKVPTCPVHIYEFQDFAILNWDNTPEALNKYQIDLSQIDPGCNFWCFDSSGNRKWIIESPYQTNENKMGFYYKFYDYLCNSKKIITKFDWIGYSGYGYGNNEYYDKNKRFYHLQARTIVDNEYNPSNLFEFDIETGKPIRYIGTSQYPTSGGLPR